MNLVNCHSENGRILWERGSLLRGWLQLLAIGHQWLLSITNKKYRASFNAYSCCFPLPPNWYPIQNYFPEKGRIIWSLLLTYTMSSYCLCYWETTECFQILLLPTLQWLSSRSEFSNPKIKNIRLSSTSFPWPVARSIQKSQLPDGFRTVMIWPGGCSIIIRVLLAP